MDRAVGIDHGFSQDLFLLEKCQAACDDQYAEQYHDRVTEFGFKFRHISEVHSIPADNECEGHEDGGYHCEDCHYAVLLDIKL